MASKTTICNQALSHIGITHKIVNIETEKSIEARYCRTFFDDALEDVLRDTTWTFSKMVVDLGLLEENPDDEWCFSYRYPSDCVKALRIQSGVRRDTRQSRIDYAIRRDGSGKIILTDRREAKLEFVAKLTDFNLPPADFRLALSYYLAALIAPGLTKADPFQMRDKALAMYRVQRNRARANGHNEEQVEEEVLSELHRARL